MTTITLDDAREALDAYGGLAEVTHPYKGGNHEFRVEPGDVPQLVLKLGGEDYTLAKSAAYSAIARLPGGSETMAERWPLGLLNDALNFFFDHRDGDFKMLVDGSGAVRQFVKPSTLLFNPTTVLDNMADAMGRHGGKPNVVVKDFVHSLEETRFSVTVPHGMSERFIDARPGDTTLGGLYFSGSLLGKSNPELSVFTDRVLCSNGMVQSAGSMRFRAGNADEEADGPMERMEEWLATSCLTLTGDPMDEEFARIQHLTEHTVDEDHLGNTLADIFGRFSIPAAAQAQVHEAMAEEADGTMYGIVQAITRAAQHSVNLTDPQRHSLMARAGDVAYYSQAICNSCQRPMPADADG